MTPEINELVQRLRAFRVWNNRQSHYEPVPLCQEAADALERSSERIDVAQILEDNCWDLRCIDIPTGGGDADIGWNVVEHHMAPPRKRVVGTGNTPLEAIRDAVSGSTEGGNG